MDKELLFMLIFTPIAFGIVCLGIWLCTKKDKNELRI